MYHHINSKTDYDTKLWHADDFFDKGDYRSALGYYQACLHYAEKNNMPTSYLEMKISDCKDKLGL